MAHPFQKIFYRAVKKSTEEENLVYMQAMKILKKGYSPTEILTVLTALQKSLVSDTEGAVVQHAIDTITEEL